MRCLHVPSNSSFSTPIWLRHVDALEGSSVPMRFKSCVVFFFFFLNVPAWSIMIWQINHESLKQMGSYEDAAKVQRSAIMRPACHCPAHRLMLQCYWFCISKYCLRWVNMYINMTARWHGNGWQCQNEIALRSLGPLIELPVGLWWMINWRLVALLH